MVGSGDDPAGAVLVVGASGVLRPAAERLIARGRPVIGVGRGGRALPPGCARVAVDAADAGALREALGALSWRDAIVYSAAAGEETMRMLRASTPGRLVHVRTTEHADPARSDADPGGALPPACLQLGWTGDRRHPWHSPEQISDAALAVLADGSSRTLGAVRPWVQRP